jgi:protein TonB
VRVTFIVAPTGGLSAVHIAQSSGDAALDAVALAAVRQARFPTPPAGMTQTELTFDIPYRFR